jgi:hypothetical protein
MHVVLLQAAISPDHPCLAMPPEHAATIPARVECGTLTREEIRAIVMEILG